MWWQELTCTGRMRRCASAGSALRGAALRLPAQAQRGLLEVCKCSDSLKAACLRILSPGTGALHAGWEASLHIEAPQCDSFRLFHSQLCT